MMTRKRKAEAPLPEDRRRSTRLQNKTQQTEDEKDEKIIVMATTADRPELPSHVANNSPPSQHGSSVQGQPTSTETAPGKPKRFRRRRQRKTCGFLNKLPGEIRNRIYRYAVNEVEDIIITSKGPGEPSLLRVCKQMRKEASSIYYAENNFELQIRNFNGADLKPFTHQLMAYEHLVTAPESEYANVSLSYTGEPDWDNLVAWIKSNHKNCNRLSAAQGNNVGHCFHFYHSAFRLADTMSMSRWSNVEEALKALRGGLKGMPSPWSEGWEESYWL